MHHYTHVLGMSTPWPVYRQPMRAGRDEFRMNSEVVSGLHDAPALSAINRMTPLNHRRASTPLSRHGDTHCGENGSYAAPWMNGSKPHYLDAFIPGGRAWGRELQTARH